jgi:limonene 1,2-monooxygenase
VAASGSAFGLGGGDLEEGAERGQIIVGTPDDAIVAIESILERSGGLGGVLGMAHEWASTEKTLHSYELWARYVAPRFQGQLQSIVDNRDWIEDNQAIAFRGTNAAFARAYQDAGKEMPPALKEGFEAARRAREAREAGTTPA